MNDKVSRYNIEIENDNCILLYNTLSNKILPISFKDYASIETLLEYLPEFQGIYPNLYNAFKKSGFIDQFGKCPYCLCSKPESS